VETFSQNVTAKTMVVHYVTSAMLNTQIKETPRINHPSQHVLLVLFSWQNDPRGNGNVFYFKKKEGEAGILFIHICVELNFDFLEWLYCTMPIFVSSFPLQKAHQILHDSHSWKKAWEWWTQMFDRVH